MKTKKSAKKRFKITGKKKLFHRRTHQNHFNAKESGNGTRNKRGSRQLPAEFTRDITQVISMNLSF